MRLVRGSLWYLGGTFDNFGVHEKCYHSSSTPIDELGLAVDGASGLIEDGGLHFLRDSFGMTPFHVLLSSASCRLDLLQLFSQSYPSVVLEWKDVLGSRAIDYVGYNWTEETR